MCGVPRLNSTQTSEAHHQFLKEEFDHVFRGNSHEQKAEQVLQRHSLLLNLQLHKLRRNGFTEVPEFSIQRGDNVVMADDTHQNYWFARVIEVDHFRELVSVRWFEKVEEPRPSFELYDFFRSFTLCKYIEPLLQPLRAIIGFVDLFRVIDFGTSTRGNNCGSIYICNTGSFLLRTSHVHLNTLDIHLLQNVEQ